MPDNILLREKLEQIRDALIRIQKRSLAISKPEDFTKDDASLDKLDAIAMMLIAIGESFKKIDRETDGKFLLKYPQIDWKGVKGVRDVLAHNYFDIDTEEIFKICQNDVPILLEVVHTMLRDIG